MSAEEERELIRRYKETGDQEACARLIESLTALAENLIYKRCRHMRRNEQDELLSEAPLVVWECLNRFDPSRGVRLSTTLSYGVLNNVGRRFQGGPISITWQRQQRDPEAAARARKHVSMSASQQSNPDGGPFEVPDGADFLSELMESEASEYDKSRLTTALEMLSDRDSTVLRGRFMDEKTLEQVGAEIGVTRERVRQIEAKALERLREVMGQAWPTPKPKTPVFIEPPIVETETREVVTVQHEEPSTPKTMPRLDTLEAIESITEEQLQAQIDAIYREWGVIDDEFTARVDKLERLKVALFSPAPERPRKRSITQRKKAAGQKRPNPATKIYVVWDWLRKNGPTRKADVITALGGDYAGAVNCMSGYRYFDCDDEGRWSVSAASQIPEHEENAA